MGNTEEYIKKLEEENRYLETFIKASGKKALKKMFNNHQAIMLLIDVHSGKILDANKAAVSFYKYPRSALLKLKIEDINTLPAQQLKDNQLKMANKEKSYFIFPHRLADGTIRQVEVYSSVYELNKRPTLYSIIHDVTDRIKAQEELKTNEEKFVSAFRSNPNCMIISNLDDGKIYDVNDAFFELTGMNADSIANQTTLSIDLYANPADRDKMIRMVKETGLVRNLEINLRHNSGQILIVLASAELLKTSGKKTIITTFLDITQRVQLENQLERNNILLQAIFDSVPAMITIYDPNISNIEINKEFEKITGWTNNDFQNRNAMELVYPNPEYRKMVAEYMQSLQPGFKDIVMTGKDGTKIETFWANVKLDDGRQVGIGIDIRERKNIENELEQKNAYLTNLNNVLEDFVKIAAHDLRSPIQNLMSISGLIDGKGSPEEKVSLFRMLEPITNRLQKTVEGLVEMVSFQIQQKIVVNNLSFENVWNEVKGELNNLIAGYNGTIEVQFNEAPKIRYVEIHLFSILRNLVSNAVKYSTDSKNSKVKVSTKNEGNFILLTIEDNGVGMELNDIGNSLFRPFRRFTSKADGIGMGLYIVKNIIERNGGSVKVESELKKGTTFYCYLKEYTEE